MLVDALELQPFGSPLSNEAGQRNRKMGSRAPDSHTNLAVSPRCFLDFRKHKHTLGAQQNQR